MKFIHSVLAMLCVVVSISAQAAGPERVRVTTSQGSFVIQLERERAPLTVENFLTYVRAGHYANTLFHRVIANFVVQGGGVAVDYKAKVANKPVPNEAGNGLKNLRGTVGLARASGAHSGDCQFYINVADNADLDPLPTRWGYAVFGRIVEGLEVVDRISVMPTGPMGPFKADAPLAAVVIQKIELLDDSAPAPAAAAPAPASAPINEPGATEPAAGEPPPAGATAPTGDVPPAGDVPPQPK